MVNVHSFLRDYFRRTLLFNLSFGISAHLAAECRFEQDRKSTRLNSSHTVISYAVFCLKKKKKRPVCSESAWCTPSHIGSSLCAVAQSAASSYTSISLDCLLRLVYDFIFI